MEIFIILTVLVSFLFYMVFKEELSVSFSPVLSNKRDTTSSRVYRSIYFTLLFVIIVISYNGYNFRSGFDLIGHHRYLGDGYYDSYFDGNVRYLFAHNSLYYFIVILSLEASYLSSISKNTLIKIPLSVFFHLFFISTLLVSNTSLSGPYVGYSIYTVLITHGLLIFLYYIFTAFSPFLKNVYNNSFLKGLYSESLLGLYLRNKKAELRRKLKEENKKLEKDE